jgi:hypothetical protein
MVSRNFFADERIFVSVGIRVDLGSPPDAGSAAGVDDAIAAGAEDKIGVGVEVGAASVVAAFDVDTTRAVVAAEVLTEEGGDF